MRIRKNANISSFVNSPASGAHSFQTHVCQLNQSPWDVIPFSHQDSTNYPFHQFEGEDSFNGNGSLGDSMGAVESVASMMEDVDDNKAAAGATIMNNVDEKLVNESHNKKRMLEDYEEMKVETNLIKSSKKSETKSWHLKNYNNSHHQSSVITSSIKKQEKIAARRGRGRVAANKKGSSGAAANPYEFYYYSGFGPLWGKRRGSDRVGELGNNSRQVLDDDDNFLGLDDDTKPLPPQIEDSNNNGNNQFDYVDEDDDEDDDDKSDGGGKKRMRKPVKARSLKSLM